MSISSTVEVKDTAKNGHISEKSAQLNEANTVPVDSVETNEAQSRNTDNVAQVIALPVQTESPALPTHPEILGNKSSAVPGDRPLLSNTINLPGNRPIAASNLQVAETVNLAGLRPIGSSNLQVSETVNLMGNRPIASSNLHVAHTMLVSGLRPIASNDIEDGQDLMGYLD